MKRFKEEWFQEKNKLQAKLDNGKIKAPKQIEKAEKRIAKIDKWWSRDSLTPMLLRVKLNKAKTKGELKFANGKFPSVSYFYEALGFTCKTVIRRKKQQKRMLAK